MTLRVFDECSDTGGLEVHIVSEGTGVASKIYNAFARLPLDHSLRNTAWARLALRLGVQVAERVVGQLDEDQLLIKSGNFDQTGFSLSRAIPNIEKSSFK